VATKPPAKKNKYLRHVAPYQQSELKWWLSNIVLPSLSLLFGTGGLFIFDFTLIKPTVMSPVYAGGVEQISPANSIRAYSEQFPITTQTPYPTYTFYPTYTLPAIGTSPSISITKTHTPTGTSTPTRTGTVTRLSNFDPSDLATLNALHKELERSREQLQTQQAELSQASAHLDQRELEKERWLDRLLGNQTNVILLSAALFMLLASLLSYLTSRKLK